jgi:hypothetical protein
MVQSKETALYQENKIGDGIQHAEQVATNYITTDETGIKVHNANDLSNYVHMDYTGVQVYKSGNEVARFGASNDADNTGVVEFCDGVAVIEGFTDSDSQGFHIHTDIEDNEDAILPWIEIEASETSSQLPTSTHGMVHVAPGDVSMESLTYDENDNEKHIELHVTDTGAYLTTSETADELASLHINCPETECALSLRIGNSGNSYGVWSDQFSKWLIAMMGVTSAAETVYSPAIYEKTTSGGSNVRVENSSYGYLKRYVSSSRRYKKDIDDISEEILDPNRLYDARVVQFRYLDDYLDEGDDRHGKLVDGFIAEELEEVYPICVNYDDGKPEDWEPKFLIPAMLKLIQDQHKEIEKLKNDISKIKGE